MSETKQKVRKKHLDVLKIIAIYCVLFNHTGDDGFTRFLHTKGAIYWLQLSFSVFVMIAVPMFLMTSGATMLKKNESYGKTLGRVAKYFVILFLVSVINYKYLHVAHRMTFDIEDFFRKFHTSNIITAYWYLYMYIAYLLMLPLLRKLVQAMSKADFIWLFVLYFIMQCITVIDFALFHGEAVHNYNFDFFISKNYIIFPFIGFFIEEKMDQKHFSFEGAMGMIFAGMAAVFATARLCAWHADVVEDTATINGYRTFINTFVAIPTTAMFYCCKTWFDHREIHDKGLIKILSNCTFGVFLFENIWREVTAPLGKCLRPYLGPYVSCHISVLCACLLGSIATFLYLTIYQKIFRVDL